MPSNSFFGLFDRDAKGLDYLAPFGGSASDHRVEFGWRAQCRP
jgi:hypothetical protein